MKTNLYILLVLLLSFSFANAQSTTEANNVALENVISVADNNDETITKAQVESVNSNETLLINASELKETIARGASDIRKYLIRERKSGNISVVFPKIYKAVKA